MAYSTISKHTTHFNTTLYSGTGSNATVTGVGFQPDFFWIKQRTSNQGHLLWDAIRGGNYYVPSSSTAQSNADIGTFTVASDGYSYGSDAAYNGSGHTYVGYNWKAGGTAPTKTYHVVVVSDSGNKYRFRNTADSATFGSSAVTLDLQEGGTYTFDVSDSTLNSHPFVIGTAANGTEYSTGVTYKLDGVTKTYSQYTSGFSAATSRQLVITLAASAPALYYWCSAHSGMGGAINTNSLFGSSNFDGNKQSKVTANQTSGFSMVEYSGSGSSSTIGHGLSSAPKMIMVKRMSSSDSWTVYHTASGAGKFLRLDTDGAESSNTNTWANTAPTSTVFSVNHDDTNASGQTFQAYCFADVDGYQKMGLYKGNESTDNAFVYTGFKPSFVIIKNIHGTNNWMLFDNKREGYNPDNDALHPNINDAEQTDDEIDLLSNGFKIRLSNQETGHNGHRYAYFAIGQTMVGSNNVPATAR